MFYITFTKKKQEIRYVALPAQYQGKSYYYQIYENGRPLINMTFPTEKLARTRLKGLYDEIKDISRDLYDIKPRLSRHVPTRNVLGLKKIYADGSSIRVTYVIRKISIASNLVEN